MKREALVVGINKYAHHPQLDSPARDAEKIAQLLEQPKGDLSWSVRCLPEIYPNGHGQPRVSDSKPVYQDTLSEAITNLLYPKTQQPPEIVLLFFAGHGFRQGQGEQTEGFLAATNTKPGTEDEKRSGISLSWLRSQLINSPVKKQIVWLDCCHSGELLNFTPAEIEQWQLGGDRCLIAACRDDKAAYGIDKHGVLTAVLLQALDPKLYPEGYWINTGTVTDFIEHQLETDSLLKRQIPLCRNFGERIRLWQGTKQIETVADASQTINTDINILVQQVRDRLHDKIQNLHGTMQLLDVAHPVEIDRLYVDVNILTEPTSYKRLEIDDLLQGQDYQKDFDRFGLSKVQKRVAGFQAVIDHRKLMVLGKPGAGKTTFLQHLVIECNNGNLFPEKVPILIKLRDFVRKAKKTGDFSLEHHVASYLRGCERSQVTALLEAGKFLLLLDGLDEVSGIDSDAIVDEIREVIENYPQNHLILTCRIQVQKYRFERFAYVEVADFNYKQIKTFSRKYFVATAGQQEGDAKAQQFMQKLNLPENKQIIELAVTPILLSLTCKVFGDTGKFYSKRHELYKEGLELLLSKWDESRGIKRDNVYRELSVKRKQELLSYIAAKKFEQEQYVLFTQEEIQGYIAEYLEISLEDSQAVLEAIESQHGLLVARAQRIYSFSHLTFQEYYTAWQIVINGSFNKETKYLLQQQWREVIFLTSALLSKADEFLWQIKYKVDEIIATDDELQELLRQISYKSERVKNPSYKIAAIRAFYLYLTYVEESFELKDNDLALALNFNITQIENTEYNLDWDFATAFYIALTLHQDRKQASELDYILTRIEDIVIDLDQNVELLDKLQKLKEELPDPSWKNRENFRHWWQINGEMWVEKLQILIIEYRDIGQTWQLRKQQKQLLEQYYYANKLLVECLNSGCAVSDDVKQEIEESLLLPIAEIERIRSERLKTSKTINKQ